MTTDLVSLINWQTLEVRTTSAGRAGGVPQAPQWQEGPGARLPAEKQRYCWGDPVPGVHPKEMFPQVEKGHHACCPGGPAHGVAPKAEARELRDSREVGPVAIPKIEALMSG